MYFHIEHYPINIDVLLADPFSSVKSTVGNLWRKAPVFYKLLFFSWFKQVWLSNSGRSASHAPTFSQLLSIKYVTYYMLHIRCTNFCINILYITFFEIRKFCKSIKRSCHNAIWIGLFICCLQCNEKWGLNKLAIEKYEIKRSRDQVNYYEFRNTVRSKVDGLL